MSSKQIQTDPHPGNVLLMDDGRIGLIDYGQVKRISRISRVRYAKCMLALASGDQAKLCNVLYNEFGLKKE